MRRDKLSSDEEKLTPLADHPSDNQRLVAAGEQIWSKVLIMTKMSWAWPPWTMF